MRLGVNTLPGIHAQLRAHEAEFLSHVLGTAREIESSLEVTVFAESGTEQHFPGLRTVRIKAKRRFLPGAGPLDAALGAHPVDVLLSPLALAPPRAAVPQVLLALDTALYEADAPAKHAAQRLKAVKRACAGARRLVVTSEYLKRRCLDLFEAPLDKVAVAPPGVNEIFAVPQRSIVEAPYIVLVQTPLSAAALPALRKTLQPLQGQGPTLVVLGAWEEDAAQWPDLIQFEQCSDAHRAALYQHAECCLYPAEHDGCAVRLLEMMRAGGLIACANTGACKEFGGDIPMHFNPQNARSLQHALERIGALPGGKREERSRLAQSRAARHRWDKCAWKLLDALQREG